MLSFDKMKKGWNNTLPTNTKSPSIEPMGNLINQFGYPRKVTKRKGTMEREAFFNETSTILMATQHQISLEKHVHNHLRIAFNNYTRPPLHKC